MCFFNYLKQLYELCDINRLKRLYILFLLIYYVQYFLKGYNKKDIIFFHNLS